MLIFPLCWSFHQGFLIPFNDYLFCFICQKESEQIPINLFLWTLTKSSYWQVFNVCRLTIVFVFIVQNQSDFLTSSSSSSSNPWSSRDLTPDEDLLDLDYMLALSLQNDGESMAGGVEAPCEFEKMFSTSVNANFTSGTNPVANAAQMVKHVAQYTLNFYVSISIITMLMDFFYRHNAAMWVLWRVVSPRGPYFASGWSCDLVTLWERHIFMWYQQLLV